MENIPNFLAVLFWIFYFYTFLKKYIIFSGTKLSEKFFLPGLETSWVRLCRTHLLLAKEEDLLLAQEENLLLAQEVVTRKVEDGRKIFCSRIIRGPLGSI